MQASQTEAGALIRSPLDRARFEDTAKLDLQRGAAELARSARQLRFNEDLATLRETALAAGDEATRVAAIDTAGEIFAAALEHGDLTPESAGQHRQDWVRDYSAKRIELARLANEGPDAANAVTGQSDSETPTNDDDKQSPLVKPAILGSWDSGPASVVPPYDKGAPTNQSIEEDGTIVVEAVRPKEQGLGWKIADKLGLHEIFGDGDDTSDKPPPSQEDSERAASMQQRLIQAQIDHSNRARYPDHIGASELDTNLKRLGAIITFAEGAGPEAYNGGTSGVGRVIHSDSDAPEKTVTGKTINEILATESMTGDNPDRMFVTGNYQTNYDSLREAMTDLQLTGEELYTEELQERIFRESLIERGGGGGLADFVIRGEGTTEDAQYAASKKWASIAVPKGKTLRSGAISDGTMSYYEEAGVNTANDAGTKALATFLDEIEKSRKSQ
jgi:hypothetical protein